jgi:hypothetical protein
LIDDGAGGVGGIAGAAIGTVSVGRKCRDARRLVEQAG